MVSAGTDGSRTTLSSLLAIYTNFDRDIFPSITNCSLSSCVSMGGAGYSYGWRLSDCSDGLGGAFCEKILTTI
jgi:hypothetical protein